MTGKLVLAASAILCLAGCSATTVTVTATPNPTPSSTVATTPTESPTGVITGTLIYPADILPPQLVVAFPVTGGTPYSVATSKGESHYTLKVPAGTYHVLSFVNGSFSQVPAAAWDKAMLCWNGIGGSNSTCTNSTLVEVVVNPGQTVANINPQDWYNHDQSWPTPPSTPPTLPAN